MDNKTNKHEFACNAGKVTEYEVKEHIDTIMVGFRGFSKEVSIVKWNDKNPVFDIRAWRVSDRDGLQYPLMYLILFCTGIRKSEVCTIKSGAFYSQGNENWMRIYQSKMRREKVIPVPSLLVGLVNDYEKKYGIKNGEYLFKNKKGGAFNGQTFSNQMIRECKVRGIACGDYIFRAHDYRHNLATSMYGNGVSIQGVRDYLGHSSENMTKQYIDFMPERIVSAEDKYFSKNQSFKLKGAEDDER